MRSISNSIIIKALALCLTLALSLAACAPALALDSTLNLAMISVKTKSLNPLISDERDFQSLTALIYEGLLAIDDSYRPIPCLAASYSTDDLKTWQITMRDDAYFHDGSRVTAYDVVATYNEILRLGEEGRGQYAALKYTIKSMSANDDKTLIVKAERAYYGTLYALTFPILPAAQVQSDEPSGSGPFCVDKFIPADYLFLTSNSQYWGGEPEVRQISVTFCATNRELISAFEYNQVDAAMTRSSSAGQYSSGVSTMNITYRTQQLETLLMNHSAFELKSVNVRKAIRFALDLDSICESVYMGMATRTNTPLPPSSIFYQDTPSAFEYNPDKARELLAADGWKDSDGDGTLDTIRDGKQANLRLRLYYYEEQDNSVRVEVANRIADMLMEVGIKAVPEMMTFAETKTKLSAGSFDLCIAAYQMDVVPDPGFLLMSGNTGNFSRYRSTAMNELFSSFRNNKNFSDMNGAFTSYRLSLLDIQQQFAEDCPFLCLYYRAGALLSRKVFTAVQDVREPEVLRGVESVKIDW